MLQAATGIRGASISDPSSHVLGVGSLMQSGGRRIGIGIGCSGENRKMPKGTLPRLASQIDQRIKYSIVPVHRSSTSESIGFVSSLKQKE